MCRELDGLSHFFYQPKPITSDVKITTLQTNTGVSSISMEDIVPVMESNAIQYAPEEIYNKKHGRDAKQISNEEMTSDDKKRLRKAYKATNKKAKNMEAREDKLVAKLNPGMGNKFEKQKTMDIIRNDKRVIMTNKNDISYSKSKKRNSDGNNKQSSHHVASSDTTSSALFKQLQSEAQQTIQEKRKQMKL